MRSAPVSPHGFSAVRGRGYRPEQADAYVEALCADRDASWERAARLTVLARRLDGELARLRHAAARLVPQSYESLGERARRLFALGQEEAAAVREGARREARQRLERARESAAGVRGEAQAYADAVRAEADERARHRLLAARAEADEIVGAARGEAEEQRGEALAALREMRQRTAGMLAEQDKERAERWAEVERAEDGRGACPGVDGPDAVARAESALSAAKRAFAEAEDEARLLEEEARACAAEAVERAGERAGAVEEETERVLREHAEQGDAVRAHIDRVHARLTAWAGQTAQ
ncbi:cellulose-binding protein [Streptomyces sp. NPDC004830]